MADYIALIYKDADSDFGVSKDLITCIAGAFMRLPAKFGPEARVPS